MELVTSVLGFPRAVIGFVGNIATWQWTLLGFAYYLVARTLRFRRVHQKARQYFCYHNMSSMTTEDAYEIQKYLMSLEFPFTIEKGIQFALFRTYGIPSISELLVKTTQLSTKQNVSRRYADTEVLITDFIANPPGSERACAAISRMNYIHSLYQRAGRISNDDMLYTLSLFAGEPIKWVACHEWREFTDMEKCAFGVFWKAQGDAMGIDYSVLPSSEKGWRDGLQWLSEVTKWSERYEEQYMVPAASNKQTADETTALLLYAVPKCLHFIGKMAVSALMDDHLRKAMIYPAPPRVVSIAVQSILQIRKLALRHLALPRPYFMRHLNITETPDKDGRYHRLVYESEPWYVKPSIATRWSVQAWLDWFSGRPVPGDEGAKFVPEGYLHKNVGPKNMEGKGYQEFEAAKTRLMAAGRGGCPFAMQRD